jgi:hypothetical protein
VAFFRECRSGGVQRSEQLALERSAALVRYCAETGGLDRSRLSIGTTDLGERARLGCDGPMVAIMILNNSTFAR